MLTTLLPDDPALNEDVKAAVMGSAEALEQLQERGARGFRRHGPRRAGHVRWPRHHPAGGGASGARAAGSDLSPVATLGGRLLAEYPFRDWSAEPDLPFGLIPEGGALFGDPEQRLLRDVRTVLQRSMHGPSRLVEPLYPRNADGRFPWAYLWAVTIPCDRCKRTFPLLGSLVLRQPYKRTDDLGQALHLTVTGDAWHTEVIDGPPDQEPPLAAVPGRKGKSARCLFPDCQHLHSLDAIKAKGKARQYRGRARSPSQTGMTDPRSRSDRRDAMRSRRPPPRRRKRSRHSGR